MPELNRHVFQRWVTKQFRGRREMRAFMVLSHFRSPSGSRGRPRKLPRPARRHKHNAAQLRNVCLCMAAVKAVLTPGPCGGRRGCLNSRKRSVLHSIYRSLCVNIACR